MITTLILLISVLTGSAALVLLARNDSRVFRIATPVVFGLLMLWLWQAACVGYHVPFVLLPPPSDIGVAFVTHIPMLAADFRQTVLRAVIPGWLIGSGAGLLAAIALDGSPFLRRGVLPLGSLVSAMPIVGIAPIMVMWFGFDWQSKAAVVVLMTFFPMLVNAGAGLVQTGAMEADLMRTYGAGYRTTLLKLRLPSAMPFVFNALKLNATLALIGAIVAEFFGTPIVGMGFRISTEAARLDLGVVWAEIVVAAAVGTLSFALLSLLERAVTFWHPSYH
ncbi:MAG TPA: ABC transporter permease [Acetobacteraceae bacterium]